MLGMTDRMVQVVMVLAICGTLVGVLLFSWWGGDERATPEKESRTTVSTPAKHTPIPRAEDRTREEILKAISQAENLLEWYRIREECRKGSLESEQVADALAEKEKELRETRPMKLLSESLALAGFEWKIEDKKAPEGRNAQFVATWLFLKKGPIELLPKHHAVLILRAWVDKSHENYLVGQPNKRLLEFNTELKPSITEWPVGDYKLVTRRVSAPLIPYRMFTFFSIKAEDDGYVGRYGGDEKGLVELGWLADLPVE